MPSLRVDVTKSGPLFNGQASLAARQFATAASEEIANVGKRQVLAQLGHVLQHPTGYYESRITVIREGDGYRVDDGNVVYGPWLEGVGSRNQTTRFKGYFTFRKISQSVDRQAQYIAERVLPRYLRRMQ